MMMMIRVVGLKPVFSNWGMIQVRTGGTRVVELEYLVVVERGDTVL